MEKSLKNTYGIIVYQEQVMQLGRDIAGFTIAQADILRRAMGKKQRAEMDKLMPAFIDGARKNGLDENLGGGLSHEFKFGNPVLQRAIHIKNRRLAREIRLLQGLIQAARNRHQIRSQAHEPKLKTSPAGLINQGGRHLHANHNRHAEKKDQIATIWFNRADKLNACRPS
jgi:hypothetical protein